MEEVINGVLNGVIEPKVAHCAGVLTGYATNLLRESTGGKQKISVFLSNMQQVKVEMLSQDEIARFCQSSEEIQYEILKTLETRGGLVDAEIKMIEKKPPAPKLDTKLLSDMTGYEPDQIKEVLAGADNLKSSASSKSLHSWTKALGEKGIRFCQHCGQEKTRLEIEDMESICSKTWGLP